MHDDITWSYLEQATLHSGQNNIRMPAEILLGHSRDCNQFIWPVMHDMPEKVSYSAVDRKHYLQFNWQVSDYLNRQADSTSYFVQDYQFALLPAQLSRKRNCSMAVFWHIPWPAEVPYKEVPAFIEIAASLLKVGVLGFHTVEYAQNFRVFVESYMASGKSRLNDPTFELLSTPLGIEYGAWKSWSSNTADKEPLVKGRFILSVDRLDYTKGVLERLQAIELFFRRYPQYQGKLTFVQVAERTRAGIDAYDRYFNLCQELKDKILAQYSKSGWQPLIWIDKPLERERLAVLYHQASLMLVNPLRDGLNLTAKEFAACQSLEKPGVLLLSRGAGVFQELGAFAVEVDPFLTEDFCDSIVQALHMSEFERRGRLQSMKERIQTHDLESWFRAFLFRSVEISVYDAV